MTTQPYSIARLVAMIAAAPAYVFVIGPAVVGWLE